jgi:hypothetical protein
MNIPDHVFREVENNFRVKILKFFDEDVDTDTGSWNLFDPGSGMEKIRIWDPESRIRNTCDNPKTAYLLPLCWFILARGATPSMAMKKTLRGWIIRKRTCPTQERKNVNNSNSDNVEQE